MFVLVITINKPRYIGFLVKEKIPLVTRLVASSGFKGLTVVRFFRHSKIADRAHVKPSAKIMLPNIP